MVKSDCMIGSIRMSLAKRVREMRFRKPLTQADLAKLSGVNRSYLADIEMGNRNFGVDTLGKTLKGLDVGSDEFFRDSD